MQIENKDKYLYWLDESHPNFERWRRSREVLIERGLLVDKILSQYVETNNKLILDIGCGMGGTSVVLSAKNIVISLDINYLKFLELPKNENLSFVCSDAMQLPFKGEHFDVVILQDVIEHLPISRQLFSEVHKVLKKDGVLYISTPNKLSVFNILSDPHWGFPFVALFKRRFLKKWFVPFFRKKEVLRDDLAELLSIFNLNKYLNEFFENRLNTGFVFSELLSGNKGIVWSDFHLSLITWMKRLKISNLISKLANDDTGILNVMFTPTFYLVCRKKDKR